MTVTAVIGGGWGSEGKGVVVAKMAPNYQAAVRVGGPNAGHSFYLGDELVVNRSVPIGWINPECDLYVGAGAVVERDLLIEEAEKFRRTVYLDPQAVVVTEEMKHREGPFVSRIGSTGEGVGAARMAKIERDPEARILARDFEWTERIRLTDTVEAIWAHLVRGDRVLLEGTQGSGLSLHHGDHPYVTSADTNVSGIMGDAGIAAGWLGHTVLVVRTFPIRVAGNSGPMGEEIEWDALPVKSPEITTVTKRPRRIAQWNSVLFRRSVQINKPCGVVVTFLDYLDPSIAGTTSMARLASSGPVRDFINDIEAEYDVPVIAGSTGGPRWSVARLEVCQHGEALV